MSYIRSRRNGAYYKIEKIAEKINAPVICVVGGTEMEFENGAAMYVHDFDKNYSIKSISLRNEKVVVELEEWQQNNIGWIGEEVIQLQETSLGVVKVV